MKVAQKMLRSCVGSVSDVQSYWAGTNRANRRQVCCSTWELQSRGRPKIKNVQKDSQGFMEKFSLWEKSFWLLAVAAWFNSEPTFHTWPIISFRQELWAAFGVAEEPIRKEMAIHSPRWMNQITLGQYFSFLAPLLPLWIDGIFEWVDEDFLFFFFLSSPCSVRSNSTPRDAITCLSCSASPPAPPPPPPSPHPLHRRVNLPRLSGLITRKHKLPILTF